MSVRYELRTIPIGEDIEPLVGRIVEVLNIRPEINNFRALVELYVDEPVSEGEGVPGMVDWAALAALDDGEEE